MNTRAQPDAGRTGHGPPAWLVSETPGEAARTRGAIAELIAAGLLDGLAAVDGRIVPTLEGRLLNDAIVRALAGF